MRDLDAQLFSVKQTQSVWLRWLLLSRLKTFHKVQLAPVASVIHRYEVLKCIEYQRVVFCHAAPYGSVHRTNRKNNRGGGFPRISLLGNWVNRAGPPLLRRIF